MLRALSSAESDRPGGARPAGTGRIMAALDGLRVLDMTQYEAGTSCTQALAWLGADVVKLERPGEGDPGRGVARGEDPRPYFLNWNSNKRSVVLDLAGAEGRDVLLRLVPHYDVFIENYGPGVIERLGIGYEALREVHPGLIYARIKGFGLSGPYAEYKSFDMVAQAAAGGFSVTGEPDGPPMRPGYTVGDSGSGVMMALAITAAYVQQQRTGEGQLIELSMQEAVTYFMRTIVAGGGDSGRRAAPRTGNAFGVADLYPCKPFGANDYVYVMTVTGRMWRALCAVIGRPDLAADPRFATPDGRAEHAPALRTEIEAWTRERTKHEAMRVLGAAGVPASAVMDTHDLFTDPHLLARDFIQTVEHATAGPVGLMRWPPLMSASDVPIEASPLLGEHTDEVLRDDLGLDAGELAALREAGAIG
jgi:formyl-CoA transferase